MQTNRTSIWRTPICGGAEETDDAMEVARVRKAMGHFGSRENPLKSLSTSTEQRSNSHPCRGSCIRRLRVNRNAYWFVHWYSLRRKYIDTFKVRNVSFIKDVEYLTDGNDRISCDLKESSIQLLVTCFLLYNELQKAHWLLKRYEVSATCLGGATPRWYSDKEKQQETPLSVWSGARKRTKTRQV